MKLKDYLLDGNADYYEITAKEILKNIKFRHPREIDVYELCEQYGMVIQKTESEDLNLSLPANVGRKGIILLNKTKSEIEERQLLAEEFSHLYLHQINEVSLSKLEINKVELQAFKLASNILLPTEWLLNIDVYHYQNVMAIMASEIAEEFNVLPEYAYKRLKLLKNNYIFGKESAPLFRKSFYEIPQSYLHSRIYIVLNNKTKFSLD